MPPYGGSGFPDPLFLLKQNERLTFTLFNVIFKKMKGGGKVSIDVVPAWMADLDPEDVAFIRNFLLASGSLKQIAAQYGVTYPTVRLRLDKLIQKIRVSEDVENDDYIALIKRLAINDKLEVAAARLLIQEYKKRKKEE